MRASKQLATHNKNAQHKKKPPHRNAGQHSHSPGCPPCYCARCTAWIRRDAGGGGGGEQERAEGEGRAAEIGARACAWTHLHSCCARSQARAEIPPHTPLQARPSRRDALAAAVAAAAAAALTATAATPLPAAAAYGEAARVFGSKPTNATGFTRFEGEGFSLEIPSKYNPSKEKPPTPTG